MSFACEDEKGGVRKSVKQKKPLEKPRKKDEKSLLYGKDAPDFSRCSNLERKHTETRIERVSAFMIYSFIRVVAGEIGSISNRTGVNCD